MNTHYSDKLSKFREYGLTLMVGDSIGTNTVMAMQQAYILARQRKYGEVMYLNTFQSDQMLDETCEKAIHKYFTVNTQEDITIVSSTIGDLANERGKIARQLHGDFKARVIVINSWEFAASDYRLRNKLLFMVNEWITHYGISVIIYVENVNRAIELGKIQRYGLGKLTAMANSVVDLCGFMIERDPHFVEYERVGLESEARQEAIKEQLALQQTDSMLELTGSGVRDHRVLKLPVPAKRASQGVVQLHTAKTMEEIDREIRERDRLVCFEVIESPKPFFAEVEEYEAENETAENELETASVLC